MSGPGGAVGPEALAKVLVEHASDVLYSFSPEGVILAINPAVETVLGYTPKEVIGTHKVFEAIHPDDLPLARAHHVAKVEGREDTSVYQLRMVRKDGALRWCELSSRAERQGGRLVAIQGILRDVTARHEDATALAVSEARYRDLWENSTDILYTHDLTGRFTSGNGTALRTYGYTNEEFLRLNIKDLIDPAHLATAQANMKAKAQGMTDRTPPYEILTRAKDGTPVWAEVTSRILMADGKPVAVAGVVRNISKRKAEEARVNLIQEMSLELHRSTDFTHALQATLDMVCKATGWAYGEAWVADAEGLMQCSSAWHAGKPGLEKFHHLSKNMRFERTEGLAGELWKAKRPIFRTDVTQEGGARRSAAAEAAGLRSLVGVPILDGERSVADLVFMHTSWRADDARWVAVLDAVATQLGAMLALRRREDQLRR